MDNTMIKFMDSVVEGISSELADVSINTGETKKNNGLKLHSVTIQGGIGNMSPCIYLDDYYNDYQNGIMTLDEVVKKVIQIYNDHTMNCKLDTSLFTNYANARTRLRGKLINTEMNKEILREIPHREILDLSLTYLVEIDINKQGCMGSIQVTNQHMKMWGSTENELYAEVKANMENNDESSIKSLAEVMLRMLGNDTELFPSIINEDSLQMYVLTNTSQQNGAVEIINEEILHNFASKIGKDLVMLPSSIHEWLIIPISEEEPNMKHYAQMVKEVNDTQVARNELLSYHVYKYEKVTGTIVIAA